MCVTIVHLQCIRKKARHTRDEYRQDNAKLHSFILRSAPRLRSRRTTTTNTCATPKTRGHTTLIQYGLHEKNPHEQLEQATDEPFLSHDPVLHTFRPMSMLSVTRTPAADVPYCAQSFSHESRPSHAHRAQRRTDDSCVCSNVAKEMRPADKVPVIAPTTRFFCEPGANDA